MSEEETKVLDAVRQSIRRWEPELQIQTTKTVQIHKFQVF